MKFRALLAEFVGTFALIFIGVLAIHNLSSAPAGLTGIAFAHGLAIACLVSATAAISGGHLNPAVTFGFLVTGKIDVVNGIGYWVAQFLGGIVGGYAAVFVVVGQGADVAAAGTPVLAGGITAWQGILAEAIATFLLMFVVFGAMVDKRAPKGTAALYIGLTVTLGILGIGPMTGGAMNPARWFGSGVPGHQLANAGVYLIGPLIGAAAAALIYAAFLEDKAPLPPEAEVRVDA